jgi:hypothetical protein
VRTFLAVGGYGVNSPVSSGLVGTELVKILQAAELSLARGGEIVRLEIGKHGIDKLLTITPLAIAWMVSLSATI